MVMIAKGSKNVDFETVKVGEWIYGVVKTLEGRTVEKEKDGRKYDTNECRIVFDLDGYNYPHRTRWITLSTHENAHLYTKYLVPLFGDKYQPNEDLDVEMLIGLAVKTKWQEEEYTNKAGELKKFQSVSEIELANPDDKNNVDLRLPSFEDGELPTDENF